MAMALPQQPEFACHDLERDEINVLTLIHGRLFDEDVTSEDVWRGLRAAYDLGARHRTNDVKTSEAPVADEERAPGWSYLPRIEVGTASVLTPSRLMWSRTSERVPLVGSVETYVLWLDNQHRVGHIWLDYANGVWRVTAAFSEPNDSETPTYKVDATSRRLREEGYAVGVYPGKQAAARALVAALDQRLSTEKWPPIGTKPENQDERVVIPPGTLVDR